MGGFSSKAELIGKKAFELVVKKDRQKAFEDMKKTLQQCSIKNMEYTFITKDSREFPVELSTSVIKDSSGKPTGFVAITKDIAYRKKAEETLRASENYLKKILNSVFTGVVVVDEKTHEIVDANPNALEAIGASKEHVIGKVCNRFICPAEKGKCPISDLGQTVDRSERVLLRANGERVSILKTVTTATWGGRNYFVESFLDITERKKAEESLRKERQDLDCIIDSSPIIIFYKDKTGKFIRVNKTFAETLKIPKEEFLGKTVFDLYSAKIAQGMTNDDSEVLKSGCPKLNIIEHYESVSGIRWVQTDKVPIFDKNGIPAGLVGFAQDITEQKKAEEALKESETKYRELINGMNDTAWVIDLDANFIDVNDAAVKVLGYSREELLSMGPTDIDNSLSREQIRDLVKRMPTDQIQVFETAHTTKDGKAIPVEISSSVVTYQGKQAVLSIARNITERKQLEDNLRVSEERFRAISNSATDAIVLMDDACKINYWNPAAERIFGYAKEEVIGKDMKTVIVPPDHREFCLRFAKEVLGNKEENHGKTIEFNALRKDRTEFPIEVSATAFKLHDRNCLLSIMRDVSEHKKMEDALKQERDMLESVTENIGAGLVMISKDYKILWMNNYLKQFTGASENNHCYSSFNTCTTVCPDCGPKKIFEGAPFDHREYCNQTEFNKDHPVWFELIATPIKDKDGNVVAALELTVNITEKKNMEAKLAEYSQELEKQVEERTRQLQQTQAKLMKSERLAAIGELAGMVGHDLRNPLTSIKGAAYLLGTKHVSGLDAIGKEMLSTIDNSIDYSNKIINDLLDYSKDIKLELTEATPKALLKNALSLIEIPKRIKIADATQDTPIFKADTGKINRVFVNLIKNAIDAMPEKGTLTITSRKAKKNVEIVFEDNGVGMTPETLSQLWTPLFTTKAKGMGFGLAICKRIIEAHRGKICVESITGKGTTFVVTLPVDPQPATEAEENWVFNASIEAAAT
jgi:PAS domain S-box-containing protein